DRLRPPLGSDLRSVASPRRDRPPDGGVGPPEPHPGLGRPLRRDAARDRDARRRAGRMRSMSRRAQPLAVAVVAVAVAAACGGASTAPVPITEPVHPAARTVTDRILPLFPDGAQVIVEID